MKRRSYTLRRRAEKQEETRRRIVEAIVALHQELGPARTTIRAIAERAGVERLTVYRHFPDEAGLLAACSTHYMESNPPPDPRTWSEITDPRERTRVALRALYRYYGRVEPMFSQVFRDLDRMPSLPATVRPIDAYLEAIRRDLAAAWTAPRGAKRRLSATIGHALRFGSWKWLAAQGLGRRDVVETTLRWIEAQIEPATPPCPTTPPPPRGRRSRRG